MKKIMIMAAGTGGHVFPGLALAEEFKKENVEVCWLGSKNGMEKQWVDTANIPFQSIDIKGLRGNGLLGWLLAPLNILKAIFQARKIIKQQQPDLVLGMGGFVCGPGGISAKLLGIKLVLHEQNAVPGLTNKLLSKIADLVIVAFPQQKISGEHVIELGNPVREGLEDIDILGAKEKFTILVLGGSRGALAINKVMPAVLSKLLVGKKVNLIHQTGQATYEQTLEFYEKETLGVENYQLVSFIENMVEAYEQADLVICRSGALTVSELIAAARPAIMIPFPFAVDDHQTANANALVKLKGGSIIQQDDLNVERLFKEVDSWFSDSKNVLASKEIREKRKVGAATKIAQEICKELGNR